MPRVFAGAVRDALFAIDGVESVERIKDAVSGALRDADPGVKVVRTGHFNNSYSPDLVLEWPGDPAHEPRSVFLRPTQSPEVLAEDVEALGNGHTVFFQLDEFVGTEARDRLGSSARDRQALVTEVGSVERLADARLTSAGAGLLASSVVRAGFGLIPEDRASEVSSRVAQGFEGASRVDAAATAIAVDQLRESLQPTESQRLVSVLQAVWLGSGGSPADFPASDRELSPVLSVESLRFLLALNAVEDDNFWERVAHGLTLSALQALGSAEPSPALQRLVRAALPRLRAKACFVRPDGEERGSDLVWLVEQGALALAGPRFTARVSERLSDIARRGAAGNGPTLDDLVRRAQSAGIAILELEATNGSRSVRYSAEGSSDITHDEGVTFVTDALGGSASIRRAGTRFRSGQHFEVNFEWMWGTGRTAARPAVGEVLWSAVNLLLPLNSPERDALRAVLRLSDQVEPSPDLQARYVAAEEVDAPRTQKALPPVD